MRLIVGITGATGAIYGIRLLQELRLQGVETHLVVSRWGQATIEAETDYTLSEVIALASCYYPDDRLGAAIASGSFPGDGMVVAPCSMKTLAGVAGGYADNLINRAADVTIKEQRKLVLLARETPLNPIHLENMLKLSRLGVVIAPPVPAFYTRPETLQAVISQTVWRVMERFGLHSEMMKRWEGMD